ncbi:MAG: 2-hydroxymuconate tautomerase [Candidatus Altiarchaeota archaeon]
MPIVKIDLWEGLTFEQKEALIGDVTEAVCKTTGAPAKAVFVLLNEVPREHWGIEGKPSSKKKFK